MSRHVSAVHDHEIFDGRCLLCCQFKILEITKLAEKLSAVSERLMAELEAFRAQKPLVDEVIAAYKWACGGDVFANSRFTDAARKLAEHKP